MNALDLASTNLLTPAVLAFALGAIAAAVKSDLKLPPAVTTLLSTYLLFAIGLKGGAKLRSAPIADTAGPLLACIVLGLTIPIVAFAVLRGFGRFSVADSAGIAAHYGSVSVVTFTAAVAFTESIGTPAEGFLPALVAVMEVPGIIVALLLARRAGSASGWSEALREVVTGKSIVLLVGGLVIGVVSSPASIANVEPFFVDPFKGILALFLLDLGVVAGQRLADIRKAGRFLVGFALTAPIALGIVGVIAGHLSGLSVAGSAVLGTMAASASYIAAPAAVQTALPDANPGLYLTAALAITFPFNLVIGIPLYHQFATMIG